MIRIDVEGLPVRLPDAGRRNFPVRALHLETVALNSPFDLTMNRLSLERMRISARPPIHRIRLLPAIMALLALFVSGGIFAHAESLGTHEHFEIASGDAGHDHATPSAKMDGQDHLMHCGANILMATAEPAFLFLLPAGQKISTVSNQLIGKPLIPEPPPPRPSFFFQS